jgi:LAO/AO transport system kinase
LAAAKEARAQYESALRLLGEAESGWSPRVHTCSAETGEGIPDVWASVLDYESRIRESGFFEQQRTQQARHWMHQTIEAALRDDFFSTPAVKAARPELEEKVEAGHLSSFAAAQKLLSIYRESMTSS